MCTYSASRLIISILMIYSMMKFTRYVGSMRTQVMVFPLIHAGMYQEDASLLEFIGISCEVNAILGDPLVGYANGMGRCRKEAIFMYTRQNFRRSPQGLHN